MAEVRVAVIGVGNVGCKFVEGVDYYSDGKNNVGLWHQKVARLKTANIKVVAAFDIDPAKVGKSLSQVGTDHAAKYHEVKFKVRVNAGILSEGDDVVYKPVTTSADEVVKELRKSDT